MHHFIAIGEFKLELQSGNVQFGSKSTIFFSRVTLKFDWWPWKSIGNSSKQHQSLCIISSPYVNSNWNYSPETAKWGCDLCDLDLWPWPFAWTSRLSMVITLENFRMMWWQEHCQKGVTDGRTSSENLISAAMKQAAPHTCFFFLVFFI